MITLWQSSKVRSFVVALLVFGAGIGTAQSRETRQMCIDEKVNASDAIFVGKATALVEPTPKIPGMKKYAVIEVQDVFKGSVPRKVNLVVIGYSAELNPDCCEVGATYLVFSKAGYDILEMSSEGVAISTRDADKFVSATNGGFSTFLVRGDEVVGWPANSVCGAEVPASKSSIYACVRDQVEKSTSRKAE